MLAFETTSPASAHRAPSTSPPGGTWRPRQRLPGPGRRQIHRRTWWPPPRAQIAAWVGGFPCSGELEAGMGPAAACLDRILVWEPGKGIASRLRAPSGATHCPGAGVPATRGALLGLGVSAPCRGTPGAASYGSRRPARPSTTQRDSWAEPARPGSRPGGVLGPREGGCGQPMSAFGHPVWPGMTQGLPCSRSAWSGVALPAARSQDWFRPGYGVGRTPFGGLEPTGVGTLNRGGGCLGDSGLSQSGPSALVATTGLLAGV